MYKNRTKPNFLIMQLQHALLDFYLLSSSSWLPYGYLLVCYNLLATWLLLLLVKEDSKLL